MKGELSSCQKDLGRFSIPGNGLPPAMQAKFCRESEDKFFRRRVEIEMGFLQRGGGEGRGWRYRGWKLTVLSRRRRPCTSRDDVMSGVFALARVIVDVAATATGIYCVCRRVLVKGRGCC